jgi:hypothetical protein
LQPSAPLLWHPQTIHHSQLQQLKEQPFKQPPLL